MGMVKFYNDGVVRLSRL